MTWRTMTDTSESGKVPKHGVASQYAEAQPASYAVLTTRSALWCHEALQSIRPGEQFQRTKLSVPPDLKKEVILSILLPILMYIRQEQA